MEKKKNEIILFEDGDVKLEVNMKEETVWHLENGLLIYLMKY